MAGREPLEIVMRDNCVIVASNLRKPFRLLPFMSEKSFVIHLVTQATVALLLTNLYIVIFTYNKISWEKH